MAKHLQKRVYTLEEAIEDLYWRESDMSGDESALSDEEGEISSDEEDVFMEGGDITLNKQSSDVDADKDWEADPAPPVCKRPHIAEKQQDPSHFSRDEPLPPTPRVPAGASTSVGEKWNDVDEPDIWPPQPTFRPTNPPGPRLICTATYTPIQLFQLFFNNSVLQTIITNTNEYGSAHKWSPSNPWSDVTLQDMFSFMSLVIYMGIAKCCTFTDYWRGGKLYSLPFPKQLMTGKKFLRICQSLHLCSSALDAANDQRRGTASYDRLCKIRPLYEEIRDACKRNYHPSQEISIGERMVASKAPIGLKQYMNNKPTRWGHKLFVLIDSKNGYTWDFSVSEGKLQGNGGKGLGYESVMELMDTQLLGTGYKLFVDNFFTSPALFRDLLQRRMWACGTIRTNTSGFPKTTVNSLDSTSPHGSIRWIRKDSLLFVQWRDTRDISLCSTLHTAYVGDTVQRRVKGEDGCWGYKDVPVPPVVKEYNRCMVGVDRSDTLVFFYKVLHKTKKWYKTFFFHFIDIAVVNAFLLHKDLAKAKGVVPLHQKAFRETLVEELAAVGSARPVPVPAVRGGHHRLVHITADSTSGRLKCRQCHAKTPVKCSSCDVPLCFVPSRDCYNNWHVDNNL